MRGRCTAGGTVARCRWPMLRSSNFKHLRVVEKGGFPMGLRAALYLRVSTTNQDTERQDDQLRAVAAARGWEIVEVYADNGKSGEKPNAGLT